MSYGLELSGFDTLLKMVDPNRLDKAANNILNRSVAAWRDRTKKLPPVSAKTTGYGAQGIPVDSGLMRQMVQARRLSAIAAEVYAGVQYSSYVHDGTGSVPARPFFEYALDLGGMSDIEGIVLDELTHAFSAN